MSTIETPQRDELVIDVRTKEPTPGSAIRVQRRSSGGLTRGVGGAVLWTFTAIAALSLWFLFHALILTSLQEHGAQVRLRAQFREQVAAATAPVGPRIKQGSPVARLDLGLPGLHNVIVVEGTSSSVLIRGPGHLAATPLPGQSGVSVIFGRSATYGAPFRSITNLSSGHTIRVTTGQGAFTYRIDRIRRAGDPILSLTAGASRLTLVTSEANGWRSGWAPDHAVYVDASLQTGAAQPAPAGIPTAVTKRSQAMEGDPSALAILVFWLQGLLLASVLVSWAWTRWLHGQTWIVGLPIVFAVLWGVSGAVLRLLPNLI